MTAPTDKLLMKELHKNTQITAAKLKKAHRDLLGNVPESLAEGALPACLVSCQETTSDTQDDEGKSCTCQEV